MRWKKKFMEKKKKKKIISGGVYIYIYIVGTRFVADRNSVGFARKTALTISFVERGFERQIGRAHV